MRAGVHAHHMWSAHSATHTTRPGGLWRHSRRDIAAYFGDHGSCGPQVLRAVLCVSLARVAGTHTWHDVSALPHALMLALGWRQQGALLLHLPRLHTRQPTAPCTPAPPLHHPAPHQHQTLAPLHPALLHHPSNPASPLIQPAPTPHPCTLHPCTTHPVPGQHPSSPA